MAGKSLGTLTIDLIAKTGGFTSGLDKAGRSSDKWRKQVENDAKKVGVAIGSAALAAAAAATAVGVASIDLIKTTSQQVTETDRWAKSLKMSTQSLLAWQFAAEKAGVSGDQMADIFKDIDDKIGDAVLNKSGEAVDALNALGLSAAKLSKASPDEQLLAIGDALGKIQTNAEKTTILESMGNDLSKLLPLFDNNNEKLQQFLSMAKDYGVAPDQKSIEDLVKVNRLFEDMEAQARGLKLQIASGLVKINLDPLRNALSDVKKSLTDPKVLQGLSDLVTGFAQMAGFMIRTAAEAGKLVALTTRFSSRMGASLINGVDVSGYDSTSKIDSRLLDLGQQVASYSTPGNEVARKYGSQSSLEGIQKEIAALQQHRKVLIDNANAAKEVQDILDSNKTYGLNLDEKNGPGKTDGAAKKLESAFRTAEQGYLRQKALIDTTGKKSVEVTELQKLQFDILDGRLEGLNQAQKVRLAQLASEVDVLNATKKANEENLRIAEYVANLQRENANAAASLDAEVVGAGQGDKARERMRERLDIDREYNEKREELERRYQNGDIDSPEKYARYSRALDTWLDERRGKLEEHFQQIDQLNVDWVVGARDGLANWLDDATNYSSQAASAMQSAMSGATSNIVDMLNDNKASWKDWSVSVLKSIESVMVNMAIASAVSGIGSLFSFGAAAGGSTPAGSYASAAAGVKLNAKGGVYESADLSKFSNSIVNSPTMFAFAKGAGLMGEAGPEAIMPLTRAADGSLGVRALDSGQKQGGGMSISIGDINISTQSQQPVNQGMGNAIGSQLTSAIRNTISEEAQRPGTPLWRAIKGV